VNTGSKILKIVYRQNATYSGTGFRPTSMPKFFPDRLMAQADRSLLKKVVEQTAGKILPRRSLKILLPCLYHFLGAAGGYHPHKQNFDRQRSGLPELRQPIMKY